MYVCCSLGCLFILNGQPTKHDDYNVPCLNSPVESYKTAISFFSSNKVLVTYTPFKCIGYLPYKTQILSGYCLPTSCETFAGKSKPLVVSILLALNTRKALRKRGQETNATNVTRTVGLNYSFH